MSLSPTPRRWWNQTPSGESAGGIFKIYIVGGALRNEYHTRRGPLPCLPGPESGQEAGQMVSVMHAEWWRAVLTAACCVTDQWRRLTVASSSGRGVADMPRYCVRSVYKRSQCSTLPLLPSPKTKKGRSKRRIGANQRASGMSQPVHHNSSPMTQTEHQRVLRARGGIKYTVPSCVVTGCPIDPANACRCAIFDSL